MLVNLDLQNTQIHKTKIENKGVMTYLLWQYVHLLQTIQILVQKIKLGRVSLHSLSGWHNNYKLVSD